MAEILTKQIRQTKNMNKETLIKAREQFFQYILEEINDPPTKVDITLGQDKYYVKPSEEDTFFDANKGNFLIKAKGCFFEKKFELDYSIWQHGHNLRIGVRTSGNISGAFLKDKHDEIYSVWSKNDPPEVDIAHEGMFYDWEFSVVGLYDSYQNQERYIQGFRHVYFRTLRAVYDELERQANESNENDSRNLLEDYNE